MGDPGVDHGVQDLRGLDRDVARAATALARWRAVLAESSDEALQEDPFDGVRRVATKTTWERLAELEVSAIEEPLRAALRRWVLALLQARVGGGDDVACAREAESSRGAFEGPQPRRVSWREAWRGVVLAKSAAETRLWLEAAGEAAPPLSSVRRRRSARRVEVARRLGLAHPWEQLVPVPVASLRSAATRLLDRTEDLSGAVWRQSLQGQQTVAATLHGAVAREAGDGWPARLNAHWLDETFGVYTRGVELQLPPLPQVAGASSFARALSLFGFAVRSAVSERSMPFALASEPAFAAAYRLGYVFGALAADPEFQRRVLGVGRRVADAQARVLARSALFEARLTAARFLLGDDATTERHDDIAARVFGARLDERFRGVWPGARDGEPARWLGLLQAPAQRRSLREAFDIDWFRNPRAWTHLRTVGAGPAFESVEEGSLDGGVDALHAAFEDALG